MKIVAINTLPSGSTGRIMLGVGKIAGQKKIEYYAFAGNWKGYGAKDSGCVIFGNKYENLLSAALARLTGLQNCFSVFGTLSLISKIKKLRPDALQLNNLHLNVVNVPLLFRFIKKSKIPVFWTLHDCWPFTGHCTHFEMVNCKKWKTACGNCPIYREYPISTFDNSARMYRKKQKWFGNVDNLFFIATSKWIQDRLSESFLGNYPSYLIKNGINLSVFLPVESEFKEKHNCIGKKIVLGVSYQWNPKKGIDVFIKLAESLPNDYTVVLVGTNEETEKQLPKNIISVRKTQNQAELAKIYSAADVFVNPTREDTFPTVNLESLACGTPVVTFRTGGSPESLNKDCGVVVEKNDVAALRGEIIHVCENKPFSKESCVVRAGDFEMWKCFEKYIELYKSKLSER